MSANGIRYEMQELNFDAVPGKSTAQMEREFWAFHQTHPAVYEVLCKLARELVRKGRTHLGISALYERCRYEFGMGDKATAPHLNNNHRAFYSRLLMQREPDLTGVFELRAQRRDREGKNDHDDDNDT